MKSMLKEQPLDGQKNISKKMINYIFIFLTSYHLQAKAENIVFETMFFGDYGMSNAYIKIDILNSVLKDRDGNDIGKYKLCKDLKLYCFSSDLINISIPKGVEKDWFFDKYYYEFKEPFYKYSLESKQKIRVIKKSGNEQPDQYYFLNNNDEIIGFSEHSNFKETNKYIFIATSNVYLNLKKLTDLKAGR